MSDDEVVAWLDDLIRLTAPMMALQAQAVREVDGRGLPRAHGIRSIVTWLTGRYRLGRRQSRRLVELGGLLSRRPALQTAMAAGTVNVEQVEAIGAAITQLASEGDVGRDVVDQAETTLLEQAAVVAPRALHVLSGRILAHVAPELADRVDAATLARKVARGRAARSFHLTAIRDGRVRCTGWLDMESAAIVRAAIDPLPSVRPASRAPSSREASPQRSKLRSGEEPTNDPASGPTRTPDLVGGDDRNPGQRRTDALVEVCRLALHTTGSPVDDGGRQLVITVPHDVTRKPIGIDRSDASQSDTVEQLTLARVRHLANDSLISPAIDSAGQVLDYSGTRRLIADPLGRTASLCDKACAIPGCDRPSGEIDTHLAEPWCDGNRVCIDACAQLCRDHQWMIHRKGSTIRMAAGGRL